MAKVERINKVKSLGNRRVGLRNVIRKVRKLIGQGFKKVKGSRRIVRMSAAERRKFSPLTNLNIRKALRKRKLKQRIATMRRNRTMRTGIYKSFARRRK